MTSPKISYCEDQNLTLIRERFGNAMLLTVEQVAQLVGTTGNNLAQMLRRGHVPFDTVRVGSRVYFPVLFVAAWLCGAVIQQQQPLTIALPRKTPTRVRSSADLRARLFALHELIDREGKALFDAQSEDGAPSEDIEQAEKIHAAASMLLVALCAASMPC
jgi:hypothetical protein